MPSLSRALGVLLLMGVASALAGCDFGAATPTPVASPSPTQAATPYVYKVRDDLQYIDMMVPHHQLAIDMARVAEEHAQHGQITGLARDIIKAQEDEIHRMLIWREELVGASPTAASGEMGMGAQNSVSSMPGMNVNLGALSESKDFDRDFINAMIPHHQSAIDMSRAAIPNLKLPELRDLAHDIITAQQVEIDRMQGWLRDWYK